MALRSAPRARLISGNFPRMDVSCVRDISDEQWERAGVDALLLILPLPVSNFPTPAVTWSDVARLCRRVCLLRERGENEEAEKLRAGELMSMLAAVRIPEQSDAEVTERLNALFLAEAERVANAAVLAEILLPMISDQLRLHPAPVAPAGEPARAVSAQGAARAPQPRSGSIADFIDDMIAQERPPPPGAQRRAS